MRKYEEGSEGATYFDKTVYLNTKMQLVNEHDDFDTFLNEMLDEINQRCDILTIEGSGYIIRDILTQTLNIYFANPLQAGSGKKFIHNL